MGDNIVKDVRNLFRLEIRWMRAKKMKQSKTE